MRGVRMLASDNKADSARECNEIKAKDTHQKQPPSLTEDIIGVNISERKSGREDEKAKKRELVSPTRGRNWYCSRVGWGIAPRLEHMFLLAGYCK